MFSELVDVKENNIVNVDYEILSILLKDRTTKKNIIWATNNYENHGPGYSFQDEITPEKITSYYGRIIKPQNKKSKKEQEVRIRDKAEVFTPAWVCNEQINLVDNSWFGYENAFNISIKNKKWKTNKNKIIIPSEKKWTDYVSSLRMEITCGEAPYLVSRYDNVTGGLIDIKDRVGILDRKFRILNENATKCEEWTYYAIIAMKSVYGYDWQGDNVLLARENLLYTFIDNFQYYFKKNPTIDLVKEIAEIISWNIFQMDGLKYVIPNSCKNETIINYTLFGEKKKFLECIECKKNNIHNHNGKYVKIMNWKTKRANKFINILGRIR